MTWRFNRAIAVILLLIGVPYYWLLIDNRPGDAAAKPVTIGALRHLADSLPGPHPAAVEMELVGWRRVPGTLFVAGSGLKRRLIGIMAFRLPVPGGRDAIIDTGLTRGDAEGMGLEAYLPDREDRVYRAMAAAGLILVTHEHPDHLGGLVGWAGRQAFQKARLNDAQTIETAKRLGVSVPAAQARSARRPLAIAPGVVVIPAPSHTPGSQMIFVRLRDGREYLFTGDIATMQASWQKLRARSRLVGDLIVTEDRPEVFAWLKTIRALKAADPDLVVVPGHDAEAVLARENRMDIREGFTLSQAQTVPK